MILNVSLTLIVLSINLMLNQLLGFSLNSYLLMLMTLVVIVIAQIFQQFKKFRWFLFVLFLNLSCLWIHWIPQRYLIFTRFYTIDLAGYYEFFQFDKIIGFYYWLRNFLYFNILEAHQLFFIVFFSLVTLLLTVCLEKIQRSFLGKYLLAVLILFFLTFYSIDQTIFYLNIYILGYLIYLMRDNYQRLTKHFAVDLIILLAIILVVNFINFVFPLKAVNQRLDPYIPDIIQTDGGYEKKVNYLFDFNSTVFSPLDNRLGGPVDLDDAIVLKVKSNFDKVYLRGRVSNRYDGSRWTNTNNSFYSGLKTYDQRSSFRDRILLEIIRVNENSSNIFAPITLVETSLATDHLFSNQENIYFYNDDLPSTYTLVGVNKSQTISDEQRYLRVSETIDEAVYDLNETIVQGTSTDREIIESIVDYLKEHYDYTLRPPYVSPDQDFVTEFLIHDNEGYCTYFASSLTILARMNGIPARYVEGYVTSDEIDEEGFSIVRQANAHAWVEVYLADDGWQTVEATPNRVVGIQSFEREVASDDDPSTVVEDEIPEREIRDIDDNFVAEPSSTTDDFNGSTVLLILLLLLSFISYWIVRRIKKRSIYDKIYLSLRLLKAIEPTIDFRLNNNDKLLLLYPFDNDIINIINKTLYSNQFLVAEERQKLYNFFKQVDQLYSEKFGQLKFYYQKMKGDIDGVSW